MVARRRTAGLSSSAFSTVSRATGSPIAPSAATAASRHSGSSWVLATRRSTTTAGVPASGARFAEGPRRALHHGGIGIGRDHVHHGVEDLLLAPTRPEPARREHRGPAPNAGGGVGDSGHEHRRRQRAHALERPQGGGAHRGVGVSGEPGGAVHVALVPGEHRGAHGGGPGGAPRRGPNRGRLVIS